MHRSAYMRDHLPTGQGALGKEPYQPSREAGRRREAKSRWESMYVEYLQILPKITVKCIIRHLCKALGTRVQH